MNNELKKKLYIDPGSQGRPGWYPAPPEDKDLLFYIQRNQNQDAIVYQVNRTPEGLINDHLPMDAYWMRFTAGGERNELNEYQNRLAYGYESSKISSELYQFQFVSYHDMTFYINKLDDSNQYRVIYQIDGKNIILNNIYVYAVEFGVFPDVKYIEFFGTDINSKEEHYKKIMIER